MPQEPAKPSMPSAPAPWELRGEAWIIVMNGNGLPMIGQRASSIWPAIAMYVNYHDSPVGPYEELLLIPGRQQFPQGPRLTISTIYVSSWASVVNGRHNWGIPKQLARFEREKIGKRRESIKVFRDQQLICHWELGHQPWRIPFSSKMLPQSWLRLAQVWDGQGFEIDLQAQGKISLGNLYHASGDVTHWTDRSKALLCCKYDDFKLHFPVPHLFVAPAAISLSEQILQMGYQT